MAQTVNATFLLFKWRVTIVITEIAGFFFGTLEGSTPRKNGMLEGTKSLKVLAKCFAYKKPREKILTVFTLRNFVLEVWINLPSSPLLVLLGVFSLCRIAVSLMVQSSKLTPMLSQLNFFADLTIKPSLSPTFMDLLAILGNKASSLGS